jgi:hypothetical protein
MFVNLKLAPWRDVLIEICYNKLVMLLSFSSRERARRFDSYIASVDQAMHDPDIIESLGSLATRILHINSHAFLPNIKHDRMAIPREYRKDISALAILPLNRQEFTDAEKIMEHALDTERGPEFKLGEYVTSTVSGASMKTSELSQWLQQCNANDTLEQTTEITNQTVARTRIDMSYGNDSQGILCYSASRPTVVVDGDMLEEWDAWNQAAIVGHEEVHALDAQDAPLLYLTPRGGASSEMVAYRAQNLMYSKTSQVVPGRRFAQDVELWRLLNLGKTGFIPNDNQIIALETKGVV